MSEAKYGVFLQEVDENGEPFEWRSANLPMEYASPNEALEDIAAQNCGHDYEVRLLDDDGQPVRDGTGLARAPEEALTFEPQQGLRDFQGQIVCDGDSLTLGFYDPTVLQNDVVFIEMDRSTAEALALQLAVTEANDDRLTPEENHCVQNFYDTLMNGLLKA